VSASIVVATAAALALSGQVSPGTQTAPRPGESAARPASTPRPAGDAGVIRGRVTGVDGRPLRQADVTVNSPRLPQPRRESTDADGRYEAGGLPPDSYTVSASKTGFATTAFGQQASYPGGRRVTVSDREILEHIDVAMPRAGTIAGRVADENGDAVMGASVSLPVRPPAPAPRERAKAGPPSGLVSLTAQPGRLLVASVKPPARTTRLATRRLDGAASATTRTRHCGAEDLTSIEIRVPGHVVRVPGRR
jgi:hypothetical protein